MKEFTDHQLMDELRKRIEERNSSLEELRILNNQLLEVNKKLSDSESLKSHFLSNISNEIVNPFTAIVGLARSISSMDETQLGQIKKMASLIYAEAFHLDFQLRNIFMAAAIEAGEVFPDYVQTDVSELISNLIDSYSYELNNRKSKIIFQPTTDALYITDPEKLEIILTNLINNALLFSGNEKNITISIRDQNGIVVSVTDHGIGISEPDLDKIFNRFSRIENNINSINRGNGLGLSISKALAELMGGSIEVKSSTSAGSTFDLILPKQEWMPEKMGTYSSAGNETIF